MVAAVLDSTSNEALEEEFADACSSWQIKNVVNEK